MVYWVWCLSSIFWLLWIFGDYWLFAHLSYWGALSVCLLYLFWYISMGISSKCCSVEEGDGQYLPLSAGTSLLGVEIYHLSTVLSDTWDTCPVSLFQALLLAVSCCCRKGVEESIWQILLILQLNTPELSLNMLLLPPVMAHFGAIPILWSNIILYIFRFLVCFFVNNFVYFQLFFKNRD